MKEIRSVNYISNMKSTIKKQSENNCLTICLNDLGIDKDSDYTFTRNDKLDKLMLELTIYTPSVLSHYGSKLKEHTKLNNHTTNDFLLKLFNATGVKDVYSFTSFTSEKHNSHDLYKEIISTKNTFVFWKNQNGIVESLYAGLRNSIAHGNIVFKDDHFMLYSVVKGDEYTSRLTFCLKIKKLIALKQFIEMLKYYK